MSTVDGFKATKDALTTAMNRLTTLFERRGQRNLLSRARDLADKLVAEQFNLVVLGQFKRGKSTLINAHLEGICCRQRSCRGAGPCAGGVAVPLMGNDLMVLRDVWVHGRDRFAERPRGAIACMGSRV
jgi:hypothetical protein